MSENDDTAEKKTGEPEAIVVAKPGNDDIASITTDPSNPAEAAGDGTHLPAPVGGKPGEEPPGRTLAGGDPNKIAAFTPQPTVPATIEAPGASVPDLHLQEMDLRRRGVPGGKADSKKPDVREPSAPPAGGKSTDRSASKPGDTPPLGTLRLPIGAVESYVIWCDVWVADDETEDARVYRHRESRHAVDFPSNPNRTNEHDLCAKLLTSIASIEKRDAAEVVEDVRRFHSLRRLNPDPFKNYKEGTTDPDLNRKIKEVIFVDETTLVYLDEPGLHVNWMVTGHYGPFPDDVGAVLNRVAVLESEPVDHLQPDVKNAFRRLIAEGVARLLDDRKSTHAFALLDQAETYLRARNGEFARQKYLIAAFKILAPALVTMFVAWLFRDGINKLVSPMCAEMFIVSCGGSIGAFFSVFYRLSHLALDARAGRSLLALEGMLRIVVSMLGAFIVALALRAGFIGALSADSRNFFLTLLCICIVSGASEQIIPTLVTRVERMANPSDPVKETGAEANRRGPPSEPTKSANPTVPAKRPPASDP